MDYTILHATNYRYPIEIHESYSIVHLQPRSDQFQYCTKYELTVAPRTRVFSYLDRFANDVQHFAVLPDHDILTVTARSNVVTVRPHEPPVPDPVTRDMLAADLSLDALYDFLHESAYVAFGAELYALNAEIGEPQHDLVAWFLHAGAFIRERFSYDKDATTVRTTVEESIRRKAGVCQDFAHILVALCRFNRIPARYVSGYIFSGQKNSILGADASHAWCEAYFPPHGWVGFDPTNNKLINDEFVKIAVGRDYRDVSPVRGVYKGQTQSVMSVNVAMEALSNQQQ